VVSTQPKPIEADSALYRYRSWRLRAPVTARSAKAVTEWKRMGNSFGQATVCSRQEGTGYVATA